MSDIPDKLMMQILVRLPIKSLLRFRSVCKSWYILISSSNFITLHKNHNHDIGNCKLLLRYYCNTQEKEIYTLHEEKCNSSPFTTIRDFDFPFDRPQVSYYTVVGCVDGLICLWDDKHERNPVTLWNPAIKNSYKVPHLYCNPFGIRSHTYFKFTFGFGFDALANDYKTLRIAFGFSKFTRSRRVDKRPLSFLRNPIVCSADIFSMTTKSWRCVRNFVPLQQVSIPIFVNGALHFLTHKDDNQSCIVSFNLNVDAFMEMTCPQGGKLNVDLDHWIVGSRGYIFLLHQFPGHQYDIWMMKEYNVEESWTKLFSIDDLGMHLADEIGTICIVGVNKNGEWMLRGSDNWIGYPVMEDVAILDIIPLSNFALYVEVYLESLVLLGDDDCVTRLQQNTGNNMQEEHISLELSSRIVTGNECTNPFN